MKAMDLLIALGGVKDTYVIGAEDFRQGRHKVRHLSIRKAWLIAAVIALVILLASCGITTIIFGESIQEWFGFYWGKITGQDMGTDQIAIINKLSQEIDLSDMDGGVTVTIDSAAGSESMFYLLIRVDGYSFNKQYQYSFGTQRLEIDPEILPDTHSSTSYGIRFLGVDENNTGLFLMDLCFDFSGAEVSDLGPLPIKLTLNNLIRRIGLEKETVKEGQWVFLFSLDQCQVPEKIAFPDTLVSGFNEETGQSVPLLLTDIVLSNADLRYSYSSQEGVTVYGNISVLLKNGTCIKNGQGAETKGLLTTNYVWYWPIPLNINDIATITIAGTEITLPDETTRIISESELPNETIAAESSDGDIDE